MIMKALWAKITRKGSENGTYPIQQATYLGRVSDFITLFPYGMHANLPVGQLGLIVDSKGRIFMGTSAVGRIAVEEGEVVLYHPQTKSKIHFKSNADLDIDTTDASGNVNINTVEANLTASGDVNVKATNVNVDAVVNLGVGGAAIARVGDAVVVAGVPGTITSGGANTSL